MLKTIDPANLWEMLNSRDCSLRLKRRIIKLKFLQCIDAFFIIWDWKPSRTRQIVNCFTFTSFNTLNHSNVLVLDITHSPKGFSNILNASDRGFFSSSVTKLINTVTTTFWHSPYNNEQSDSNRIITMGPTDKRKILEVSTAWSKSRELYENQVSLKRSK